MKRIGLMVHGSRKDTPQYALRAVRALQVKNAEIWADVETARELAQPGSVIHPLERAESLDCLLSLGGDGTLLRAMQQAVRLNAPLLGINLGHMGFLTEAEPENLEETLAQLLCGKYSLETRYLLRVMRERTEESFLALNDVVVSRGGYARLITLDAYSGEDSVGHYVADGLVVATPTGSTGYSLSAGGPVIHPAVDCMVITPICAHSLQHRPVVVPGSERIHLVPAASEERTEEAGVVLQVDGQTCAALSGGENILIRKAEETVRLVRFSPQRFFHLAREKLTEWSR